MNQGNYLRAIEAAKYVRLSSSTLAKMRLRGDGPPFIKAGSRSVLYAISDLDAWLGQRTFRSTSEAAKGWC